MFWFGKSLLIIRLEVVMVIRFRPSHITLSYVAPCGPKERLRVYDGHGREFTANTLSSYSVPKADTPRFAAASTR
jgi:hypothetical protein